MIVSRIKENISRAFHAWRVVDNWQRIERLVYAYWNLYALLGSVAVCTVRLEELPLRIAHKIVLNNSLLFLAVCLKTQGIKK